MDEGSMMIGAATALKYCSEGWVDILYSAHKRPIGMWLKSAKWGQHEHVTLTSMSSMLKVYKKEGQRPDVLPSDLSLLLHAGVYRIVENTIDNRGGMLVIIGDIPNTKLVGAYIGKMKQVSIWKRIFGG